LSYTFSFSDAKSVDAAWNSMMLKTLSKEGGSVVLDGLLHNWKSSLRKSPKFKTFLGYYNRKYSDLIKEIFHDLLEHKISAKPLFLFELSENYIMHDTEALQALLDEFSRHSKSSLPLDAMKIAIRKFVGNFYSYFLQSAKDLEPEMDRYFEKFAIMISTWFDSIPEVCQVLFEPEVMSNFLGLWSLSRLRTILTIYYKAFTDLNLGKFQVSNLRLIDTMWGRHLHRLTDLCLSSGLLKSYVQICTAVCESVLPTHESFARVLISSVLAMIEKSDSDLLLELLSSCSQCSQFAQDVGPYLKRWMLSRSPRKALVTLFQVWHHKVQLKSLDGRLYAILGDLIQASTDVARIALLILDQCPPNEIVDLVPKLARCLQYSALHKQAELILQKQKEQLNQESATLGEKWLENIVQTSLQFTSETPGSQALIHEYLRGVPIIDKEI
jgi:hypothetical protein